MSASLNELHLPNRILLGSGPSNVHPRVLQAMLTPMLGHLDPDFWPVLDHVRDMLRLVLGTTHTWTLPLPATGTAGMEAAFCNVVEPGDRVVIVVNGFFGGRMVEIALRCGAGATVVAPATAVAPACGCALPHPAQYGRRSLVTFRCREGSAVWRRAVSAIA